ncbi:MAG: orotidine-5'-phosphate decarboxylase [Anaerolineaceae bacterium]|nr:orotidine-5'-phosphate decarboxylase [Anaerolineaceae bacterium]
MDFYQWLADAAQRNGSLLCVGLDTRLDRLPAGETLFDFNRRIVDATRDLVCAYKPNSAFYEVAGPEGLEDLRRTVAYVHEVANVPVILDAKRGDIGSTAEAYARAAFQTWGADALTVSPYLGGDSVAPFTAHAGRGVFVLCHTSNLGATDLQTLPCQGRPLFEIVAEKGAAWGTGLVVGATYPQALARVRALAPEAWILLPGVGAQGGDLAAALAAGLRADGLGLVINSSREVLYAPDPRQAALGLRDRIEAGRIEVAARAAPAATPGDGLSLALFDIGAVQFGRFTLASGQESPIYMDLRLLASHPAVLRRVAQAYARLVSDRGLAGADVCLAAIPYAALPIGTAVAMELDLPLVYPRKEAKAYGTARQVEGQFRRGDRAVVLDDLVTTGGSKLAAIEPLQAAGLEVRDVVVLIDREQGGCQELAAAGYRLHAVLGLRQILDELVAAGRIDAGRRDEVAAFLWGG